MNNIIIYGIHAIQSLLKYAPERFHMVFISNNSNKEGKRLFTLIKIIHNYNIMVRVTNRHFLDKKTKYAAHQGIVAYVKPNIQYQESDLSSFISKLNNPFLLILDSITDPHNLGACLRSADAAGVDAVIVPRNHSAQLNGIAQKVACGAAVNIPMIKVTSLVRTIRQLQKENIWIIGATEKADHTLYQSKITQRIALIIGAEEKGMRQLTSKHCDELIYIPTFGSISSLNVSVATGICLFEMVRQRMHKLHIAKFIET